MNDKELFNLCDCCYIIIYPIYGDQFEVVIKGEIYTEVDNIIQSVIIKRYDPVCATLLVEQVHEAQNYMTANSNINNLLDKVGRAVFKGGNN